MRRTRLPNAPTANDLPLFTTPVRPILMFMEDALQDLRGKLAELERKLATAGSVEPSDRELLEQIMADIEQVLAQQGGEAPPQEVAHTPESLVQRLGDAARNFEETHPTLSGAVGSVIDALSRMGI